MSRCTAFSPTPTYEHRDAEVHRDPAGWTDGAARHLAFHQEIEEYALGDRGALHEILADERVRAAQRARLGDSRQSLEYLRRGLRSAVRNDRVERVAEVLPCYAGEDHASRSRLGAWPTAHAAGDLTEVLAVLLASRRPDLDCALLAWEACVAVRREGRLPPSSGPGIQRCDPNL